MAKISKILIGTGKCVMGGVYGGLAITARVLAGPYSKLQPELRPKEILETMSHFIDDGVDDIREGVKNE